MTAIVMKHFDVLEFVKKATESGIKSEFAEYQARQIEQLAEIIQEQNSKISTLEAREPATKKDLEITKLELQKEIESVKLELQKEIEIVRKEIESVRKEIEILRKEMFQLNNKTMQWMFSMFVLFGGALISVMAKGFHWW